MSQLPVASEALSNLMEIAVNSSHGTTIAGQHEYSLWTTKTLISIAAAVFLSFVLTQFFSPRFDPREPPVLKPFVPFIGHIVSLIRHKSDFLPLLTKYRMPIASLPMLNGKIYAVFDASLIQSVYRNKNLSFEPFVVEFAQRELGYDDEADKLIREKHVVGAMFDAIHEGMGAHYVHSMNANALRYVGDELDKITGGQELNIPNLYIWTRDLMTLATCEALYGPENPLKAKPSLVEDLWAFESDLPLLLLGVYPSITARKAYKARASLQAGLKEYYLNFGDQHQDAAGITKYRAATLRSSGIKNEEVGAFELALLHVATSNTIPTLFWLLANVFTRPELVERLREEASDAVERGSKDEAMVNIDGLADTCPLLVSCYRETIRLCNKAIGNRRVMADTTISDGKGNTYLLKEGVNVQMPSDPLHLSEEVWGANPHQFDPERFLEQVKGANNDKSKARRISYVPFGGGRHLCPGRNFAFAENLGLLVALVLGFDLTPTDASGGIGKVPVIDRCSMAAAVAKPENGGNELGIRIKRREGWETTSWKFKSGSR